MNEPWRIALTNYETKRKRTTKRPLRSMTYTKSASIVAFEDELWAAECKKYPLSDPRFIPKTKFEDRTANGLTTLIEKYIIFHGGNARRVNTMGIYNPKTKKWRRSGSTRGAADIAATWKGRPCQFEVKVGKDKPREDQLKQQERERAAGGVYEFVHSFDEFLDILSKI